MKLYQHQVSLIERSSELKRCLIAYGTGSGKTITSLMMSGKGETLIVAPKTTRDDKTWEKALELSDLSLNLSVRSKEDFRKLHKELPPCKNLIIDEAHTVSGVRPTTKRRKGVTYPQASQLWEAVMWYVKEHNPERIYLLTATPTRNPLSVWALAQILGHNIDYFTFREKFYTTFKMGHRDIWKPRTDKHSQDELAKLVNKIGVTGQLSDFVDVPEQTHREIHCEMTREQKKAIKEAELDYPDVMPFFIKSHQIENGILYTDDEVEYIKDSKIDAILDLAEEFKNDQMLIFAKYKGQIQKIADHITDRPVFTLTGETKDRGKVLEEAQNTPNSVLIAQSSVSAGYNLKEAPICIFASLSYSHIDLEQGRGRIQRLDNIKKNLYVYLSSGPIDKSVLKRVKNKEDFHLALFNPSNK